MEVTKVSSGGSSAHQALNYIRRLYAVERFAEQRALDDAQIVELRREKALPLVKEFHGG